MDTAFSQETKLTHEQGESLFPNDDHSSGRYQLIEPRAQGGQGSLWKAKDLDMGRNVALKFILEGKKRGGEEIAKLKDEAKKLARLNHPEIDSSKIK